jgi:hypothetical protein
MFRGFGLQSAGGCSEARGPTHTHAQTTNVSRIWVFTALLSFRGSSRPVRRAWSDPRIHALHVAAALPLGRQLSDDFPIPFLREVNTAGRQARTRRAARCDAEGLPCTWLRATAPRCGAGVSPSFEEIGPSQSSTMKMTTFGRPPLSSSDADPKTKVSAAPTPGQRLRRWTITLEPLPHNGRSR